MSQEESPIEVKPLLNLHQVLACADPPAELEKMVNANFRLPPTTKKLAEEICRANGSDLSTFLRSCCETLVVEYMP